MQTSDLVGKNVVLAGTFSTMVRATAQKLLTAAGAIVGTGVTPTTDLVFLGYNGERLAEKARSQGTAVMDELEMRALLVAAGQLPGPRKEPVADPAEMRRVVEELWTFLEALARREDIRVGVAVLGRPAGTYELDQLRVQRVPTDLVQLYAIQRSSGPRQPTPRAFFFMTQALSRVFLSRSRPPFNAPVRPPPSLGPAPNSSPSLATSMETARMIFSSIGPAAPQTTTFSGLGITRRIS